MFIKPAMVFHWLGRLLGHTYSVSVGWFLHYQKKNQSFPSLLYLNNDKRCFHLILREKRYLYVILSPTEMLWRQFSYIFLRKIITLKRTTVNRTILTGRANWHLVFKSFSLFQSKKKKKAAVSAQITGFSCLLQIPKALKHRNSISVEIQQLQRTQ